MTSSWLFIVTENRTEQERGSPAAILVSLRIFKWLSFLQIRIFQDALLAISTEYWYLSFAWVGPPNSI